VIFVDTGVWYAAAVDEGERSVACQRVLKRHVADLATSDAVLAELWLLLQGRGWGHLALPTVADIVATSVVLSAGHVERRTALEVLAAWPDQGFSYTDALSFAMMEAEGITTAASLDRHFSVYRYGQGRRRRFRVIPT
jgi:uncharacterized protein